MIRPPDLTIQIGSTTLVDVEQRVILATLEHCGRHKQRTADALGICLKTLYNKLNSYRRENRRPS